MSIIVSGQNNEGAAGDVLVDNGDMIECSQKRKKLSKSARSINKGMYYMYVYILLLKHIRGKIKL